MLKGRNTADSNKGSLFMGREPFLIGKFGKIELQLSFPKVLT